MLQDSDLLALQEVRIKVDKAYAAWQKYRNFSQEQIDQVVEAAAAAARDNAQKLAEMAVQETGYGNVPDKVAKNLLSADVLARSLRGVRTVGILRDDKEKKVVEIGVPMGVIAAQLGHSDTRMTEKHYAHLAPSYVADTIRANFPNLGLTKDSAVTTLRRKNF